MDNNPTNSGPGQNGHPTATQEEETQGNQQPNTTTSSVTHTPGSTKKTRHRRFTKQPESTIIKNLSSKTLSPHHRSVLQKGLNFIPHPKANSQATILQNYLLFERKIRLKHYWYRSEEPSQSDNDSDTEEDRQVNILKPNKGWTPPNTQDRKLEEYCMKTRLEVLLSQPKKSKKHNLTADERRALQDLRNDTSIVIKPADKGGATVILDKTDYEEECLRQLSDTNNYEPVRHNPLRIIQARVRQLVTNLKTANLIDDDEAKVLSPNNTELSKFYILPKIHKPGNPGRPIVTGTNCPTEKLSAFVDGILRPYVENLPSYIKDTTHFLQILSEADIQPDDILVTIDVKSLYTSIPQLEGAQTIGQHLFTESHQGLPVLQIQRMILLILRNNYFTFNNKTYKQVQGTAMGTRMAPSYANIFMHAIEYKIQRIYREYRPKLWKRFIDDIFMVWQHGEANLKQFERFINSDAIHNTIKFTMEYSHTNIAFLDVMVYKGNNGRIETTIYNKPTDAPTYLHYSSHHPLNQKKSVPYGLMIRARRICSEENEFKKQTYKIMSTLKRVGYPQEILETTMDLVSNLDRQDLLEPTRRRASNNTRLITQYNECNPNLRQLITRHSTLLDQTRKPATPSNTLQVTHSRATNLRNILVSSDHPVQRRPRGCSPCAKPCASCPLVESTNFIQSSQTGKKFPINIAANCQDINVIYVITCRKCKIQYVGETGRTSNERFRNHEASIRKGDPHPVAQHYSQDHHSPRDMKVTIIDKCRGKNQRLRLEEAWMLLLDTMTPNGLNGRT